MTNLPKHIILSRKGFDSSAGGYPNWLYNGKLYPIPIPQAYSGITYKELQFDQSHNYYKVMSDLGITQFSEAHLDPDIHPTQLPNRTRDWRPIFGQHGAALSHLNQREVSIGDLFLFFGWFKELEQKNGKFQYKKGAPDLHLIWGYLEIGEIIDLSRTSPPSWMDYHAHCVFKEDYQSGQLNSVFIAKERATVFDAALGASMLAYNDQLVLTERQGNKNRGLWRLPSCFFDQNQKCLLSYHEKRFGTPKKRGWLNLASANRGQEFVLDTSLLNKSGRNNLRNWLSTLING
ncbi:MAG: hypothetical protein ACPGJS_19790 [Flammeovirgaceae bacterium]